MSDKKPKTNKKKRFSFVWLKPRIDKDSIVVNGKFFVFLFCSLVSSFVNLIFVANLTKSPYTIGTLLSVPGAVLLGFLSISLDLSKALHVIQVNTLGELYQEVNGRYTWSNKIRGVRNRWFFVYVLYVLLSVVTSVSLSTISIGAGITRNANTIKQIDSAIEQGEKYYNISDTTKNISLQGIIKQATDTTEDDAIASADRAWASVEALLTTYQEERIEFETQFSTAAVNSKEELSWQGNTIIPLNYWTKRNNEVASRVQNSGYTGRTTGPALKTLDRATFIKNVRDNAMKARESVKASVAIDKLNDVNDSTMKEAYNWVLELNNIQFLNPKTNQVVEFDSDESKPVKVLINSALTRLKALRVDVENDNGDIGSSSKIFMQVGSWVDSWKNKSASNNTDLDVALETKSTGSFGTTEVMMMLMLLFLSLLCELAINQFSPKTLISRKMLSQFAKYFPSDFDVDDFMLGVLIRQLKYGDISKEKFEKLAEQTALMSKISKQSLMEKYTVEKLIEKKDDSELRQKLSDERDAFEKDLALANENLTLEQQKVVALNEQLRLSKESEEKAVGDVSEKDKLIFEMQNKYIELGDRNKELESKIIELSNRAEQTNDLKDSLERLKDALDSAKETLSE